MNIVLSVLGTYGDVLPFLAIGRQLAQRGHDVSLYAPEPFRQPALRSGLGFDAMCTEAEYDEALSSPNLWHPRRGLAPLFDMMASLAGRTMQWLLDRTSENSCLVIASPNAFGARLAQDKGGVPVITIHVTPFLIESRNAAPWLPGVPLQGLMPSRLRHWLGRGADRVLIDPVSLPPLNDLRVSLGLSPVKRLRYWWNSPLRIILMCPPWYVPPQPDWPRQLIQVGFPMADRLGDVGELTPTLEAYLDAGPAPLVFTYGSGMREGAQFFRVAVEICRRMRRRGILLAHEAEQVPDSFPADVIHVRYAPLSLLLPRSAALIHHGGIGTVAQALAAGVPQMVVPVAFNHFDDAQRLSRLGLGAVLRRQAFRPRHACREIERMLASPAMVDARTTARRRMTADDGVASACDEIERVAGTL